MNMSPQLGGSMAATLQTLLGRAIVRGDYEHEAFPNEGELAVRFKASRTVTREAVKMLTAKGMVSSRPKTGTRVEPAERWNLLDPEVIGWIMERPFSPQVYREFNQMRQAFEPMAAGLAARAGNQGAIDIIGGHLQAMKHAGDNLDALIKADMDFHVAILKACGNPFFWQLKTLVETALYNSVKLNGEAGGADISLREAVFDAIQDGDGPQAELAMRWLLVKSANLIDKHEPAAPVHVTA